MLMGMCGNAHFSEQGVHGFSNESTNPPKLKTAEIEQEIAMSLTLSKMLTSTKCFDILKHVMVRCVIIEVFYL